MIDLAVTLRSNGTAQPPGNTIALALGYAGNRGVYLNPKTKHYDIYAKIKGANGSYTMEQLDDTTVDLSGYMQKENGKRLMTDAEGTKLAGIAEGANKYTHPTYTARSSGLYKVTVDASGHVTEVVRR